MRNKYLKITTIILGAIALMAIIFLLTQKPTLLQDSNSTYKANVSYPTTPFTLTLWLPSEEKDSLDTVITEYKKIHPGATVKTEYIDSAQYQTRLLQASTTGTLPDLFVFRNDGLPLYKKYLQPAPTSVFTTDQFTQIFAGFTTKQLVSGNTIYGAPLGLATLGLIYNQDRFTQASITTPPVSWLEFDKTNDALRKKDGQNLYLSGVALGTSLVRNYPDIISALMMQNGALMTDQPPTKATFELPDSSGYSPGSKAVEYYASFAQPAKQNYSWSDSLGESVAAFAQNKTALIVDYPMSSRLARLQNPNLRVGMAALPQTNASTPINYGIFLTGGVSQTSKQSEIAWDFWGFATSKEEQKKFSLVSFWPASRNDLIKDQLNDKELAPFAKQSATATDWYRGINYATNADLREMLNSYLAGFDSKIVVKNASSKVTGEIQKSNQ